MTLSFGVANLDLIISYVLPCICFINYDQYLRKYGYEGVFCPRCNFPRGGGGGRGCLGAIMSYGDFVVPLETYRYPILCVYIGLQPKARYLFESTF